MRTYRAILCSAAALCAVAACGPDASAPSPNGREPTEERCPTQQRSCG